MYITFPELNNDDKALSTSQFVLEVEEDEDLYKQIAVPESDIIEYGAELLRYKEKMPSLIDPQLIDLELERFKLSSTSLNKYLKCPVTFYYENILRVPSARNANTGYGNAVHWAMERFFIDVKNHPEHHIPEVNVLLKYFEKGMERYASHFTQREYDDLVKHGHTMLLEYYETYKNRWVAFRTIETEYKVDNTAYQDVPITGMLDKVEVYDDHVIVIDYKTGKPNNASSKLKAPTSIDGSDLGGDYWRQIVFYKILIDQDTRQSWNMKAGIMDFVEKDSSKKRFIQRSFEVEPFEVELVGEQITQTYQGIKDHKFEVGCQEEDCKWCQFVAENEEEAKSYSV